MSSFARSEIANHLESEKSNISFLIVKNEIGQSEGSSGAHFQNSIKLNAFVPCINKNEPRQIDLQLWFTFWFMAVDSGGGFEHPIGASKQMQNWLIRDKKLIKN